MFVYTGYVANFRCDLRDGTTVAAMMRQVFDEFNVPGINIYADNLFVTVDMLRWCKQNHYNLCGTTRRNRGFPAELDFAGMKVGNTCCADVVAVMRYFVYLVAFLLVTGGRY